MPITRTDFSGLTDTYLDTSGYNLDPSFTALYLQDPKEIDQRRIRAYKYFMDFYKGRHWEETGEFNPAFGNKSLVQEELSRRSWNITKNIVDKLVSFMVKEPWTIKLPAELEPKGEADTGQGNPIHDTLEAVWTANNRMVFSYQMAFMGCITGDCFIKISYDEDFYADGVGELKFTVLDSRTVMPFFDGLDRSKLIGARIQYPVKELQADGSTRQVMYKEVHTDASIVYVMDDEVQSVVPNPLGELLIVHIKNEPLPWERFGRSDIYDLIMPNKEYNEKLSDLSEILAYHAAPVTIVKGARVENLQKGARKVWGGIPKDGDVFNLSLDADLSSSLSYLEELRKFVHETGSVPEETLSNLQNVSNTSGSALHLQYQPILDRIQRKYPDYATGIQQINRIILRFYEAVGALDLPEDVAPALKYKTIIEWGSALPRDRSIDLADISTELGLMIESKRGALKRLGEENPESKLEEIRQEQLEQAEMDFMTAGLGGFGDPEAGPDGMGGEPGDPSAAGSGADDGTQNDVKGAVKSAKTNPVTQGSQTSVQAVKKSAQTTTGAQGRKPKV